MLPVLPTRRFNRRVFTPGSSPITWMAVVYDTDTIQFHSNVEAASIRAPVPAA
jgi:hypothetical protein